MIAHFRKKIVKTFQNKKHGQIETQFQASTGKEKSLKGFTAHVKSSCLMSYSLKKKEKVYSHYLFIYLFFKWWRFGG